MLERMKIALFIVISDRLMDWKQWLNRFGRFNSRDNLEHKAEHNNCRMRASYPDMHVWTTTVSASLRVRASRTIHLRNHCTG